MFEELILQELTDEEASKLVGGGELVDDKYSIVVGYLYEVDDPITGG
ncbi:MAG: hypothetical protein QNJ54_31030 [Prochloraceae cyanobacterium]|nr:hypothetical protein [Prochloraceae cyanobacterium]